MGTTPVLPGGLTAAEWLQKLFSTEVSHTDSSGNNTLTAADCGKIHKCGDDGSPADYSIVLPPVANCTGMIIGFQMLTTLTKIVTLDGNDSETIDGATTRSMWAGETAILRCDGSTWSKIGGKTIPFRCTMYMSAATQTISDAVVTTIALDTALSNSAHQELMADTGNNKILIKRSGQYNINAKIFAYNAGQNYNSCSVLVYDGSAYYINEDGWVVPTVAKAFKSSVASLGAGSYLILRAYVDAAAAFSPDIFGGGVNYSSLSVEEIISW